MLWAESHRPHRIDEVVGNTTAVEELRRWALDWERGKKGVPLLLWGPPGCGKGAAAFALAETMGWEITEMNASDLRNKDAVQRIVGHAGQSAGLFGKRKLILIDDVDALSGRQDRGGSGAILEVVKSSENPVVLTALDYWDQGISSLRGHCRPVEFKRVHPSSIASLLGRVLEEEGIEAGPEALSKIAEMSNGDIRSSLNDLQAVAQGRKKLGTADLSVLTQRDRERSIWEAIRTLLKATTYDEAVKVAWGVDVDPDMFLKWVEENVPLEYTGKQDLARAFNALSRADIYAGRIMRRQHWGFMRYGTVMSTAGVALAKDEPYRRYVKYSFPGIIRKLSASKISRARLKAVGLKIGARCHASSREGAVVFLPLVRMLMESNGLVPEIATYFDFDVGDVALILGKSEAQAEKLLGKAAVREEKPKRKKK